MPAYYFTYYPSDKIARFMSKEKPEYSLPTKSKFDLSKMDNPSEFLQRQFGVDEEDIKPFDRVKAAQNLIARQQRILRAIDKRADELAEKYGFSRDDAEFQAEMEADIHKAAKKPEYWGLTWDELEPVYGKVKGTDRINPEHIRYYITKDNIRFPPVQWESEKSGKIFEALAQYIPEGEDRERTRYNKLYFRDNDETIEGVKLNTYTLPTDDDLDDFRKTYLDIEKGRLERAGVDLPYFSGNEEKERRQFADWLKKQERANAVETKDGTTLVPIKRVNAYSTEREEDYDAAVANKPRADRHERIKHDYANLRQPQAKRDAKRTAEEQGERYVDTGADRRKAIKKAEEEAKAEAEREETRRKEEAEREETRRKEEAEREETRRKEEAEAKRKEEAKREAVEKARERAKEGPPRITKEEKAAIMKQKEDIDRQYNELLENYRSIADLEVKRKEGQDAQQIKDKLFRLIGRKDLLGKKNTPPKYGKTLDEILKSIQYLERGFAPPGAEMSDAKVETYTEELADKLKDEEKDKKVFYKDAYDSILRYAKEAFSKTTEGDNEEIADIMLNAESQYRLILEDLKKVRDKSKK